MYYLTNIYSAPQLIQAVTDIIRGENEADGLPALVRLPSWGKLEFKFQDFNYKKLL